MEPVGLAASLGALIGLTQKIFRYCEDVKDAPSEVLTIVKEVSSTRGFLEYLLDPASSTEKPSTLIDQLRIPDGSFSQLQDDLAWLESRLKSHGKWQQRAKQWTWYFEKPEIEAVMRRVERIKSTLHGFLTCTISAQAGDIKKKVDIQQDEKNLAVQHWVTSVDYLSHQQEVLKDRHEGTGQWFLRHEAYEEWSRGSDCQALWCSGCPGVGKTVMAATIVHDLESHYHDRADVMIAVLFCRRQEEKPPDGQSFFASLLRQILQRHPTSLAAHDVMNIYDDKKDDHSTTNSFNKVFAKVVPEFAQFFVVIDALDEIDEDNDIRNSFLEVLRRLSTRTLVTSRADPAIKRVLSHAHQVKLSAQDHDVRSYTSSQVLAIKTIANVIQGSEGLRN